MKTIFLVIILLGNAMLTACFATSTESNMAHVVSFSESLQSWSKRGKITATDAEMDALLASRQILLAIADNPDCRSSFWSAVRQETAISISWTEAEDIIMSGKVVKAVQHHNLNVRLITSDGKRYTTEESAIDEIYRLIGKVDPRRVFIQYITE